MAGKKETRIMKVTMDAEEFEKFDRCETRSNRGIRDESGKLSALPDIETLSEDDLPYIETDDDYENEVPSIGAEIVGEFFKGFFDALDDPEIREDIRELGRSFWAYRVRPHISNTIENIKYKSKTGARKIIKKTDIMVEEEPNYEIETIRNGEKITISGEEAKLMVEALRNEARKMTAMIFLLSNVEVKDDESSEKYRIEQSFINELTKAESKKTMEMLIEQKNLLDESTVTTLSDFLNGYIRKEKELVPISVYAENRTNPLE